MNHNRPIANQDFILDRNANGIVLIMEDSEGKRVKGYPSGNVVNEFVCIDDIAKYEKRFGKKFCKDQMLCRCKYKAAEY